MAGTTIKVIVMDPVTPTAVPLALISADPTTQMIDAEDHPLTEGEAHLQMAITDTLMIDADHHLRDEEDHHPKGNIAEGPLLMTAAEAQMTAEGRMTAEVPHRREGGAHHEMVTVVTIDEDLHLKGGDLVLMTDEVHHLMTGEDPLLTDVDPLLTDADPHLMTDEDHLGGCRTSRKDHQMRTWGRSYWKATRNLSLNCNNMNLKTVTESWS